MAKKASSNSDPEKLQPIVEIDGKSYKIAPLEDRILHNTRERIGQVLSRLEGYNDRSMKWFQHFSGCAKPDHITFNQAVGVMCDCICEAAEIIRDLKELESENTAAPQSERRVPPFKTLDTLFLAVGSARQHIGQVAKTFDIDARQLSILELELKRLITSCPDLENYALTTSQFPHSVYEVSGYMPIAERHHLQQVLADSEAIFHSINERYQSGKPKATSETERLGACWKELRQVLGMFDVRDLNNLSTSVRKELQQARCRAMEDISASANRDASSDGGKAIDTLWNRDSETLKKLLPKLTKQQQFILISVWDQREYVPFRVLRKNWKGNTRDPDSETIIRAITRTNEKLNEILDNLDIELEFGTNRDSVRIVFACEKPRK